MPNFHVLVPAETNPAFTTISIGAVMLRQVDLRILVQKQMGIPMEIAVLLFLCSSPVQSP